MSLHQVRDEVRVGGSVACVITLEHDWRRGQRKLGTIGMQGVPPTVGRRAYVSICARRVESAPTVDSDELRISTLTPQTPLSGLLTCFGRPRIRAKQNFQNARPQTANTTVEICLPRLNLASPL